MSKALFRSPTWIKAFPFLSNVANCPYSSSSLSRLILRMSLNFSTTDILDYQITSFEFSNRAVRPRVLPPYAQWLRMFKTSGEVGISQPKQVHHTQDRHPGRAADGAGVATGVGDITRGCVGSTMVLASDPLSVRWHDRICRVWPRRWAQYFDSLCSQHHNLELK